MGQVAIDKTKSYVLSIFDIIPNPMSVGEVKAAATRINQETGRDDYASCLIETAILQLITDGKIYRFNDRYIGKRHVPRFRTLDADWQW